MARFDIISKDGNTIRYSGKPRYNGSYLKPSFLEFSEIASPTPIAWEVGDYVDYPRTGMRYRLYSIPQPSKNARKGSYGGAFTYSNVQFHAATKELEIALFRDLVANDNNIHFSTSPDVATYENVEGIARRIQACMDYFYPGRWEIRMAEFDAVADAEVIEKISTAKDFAMSGGTCLDALSKIYELWEEIGWVHTHENGKEVITIGYANKRIGANTTDVYLYGKGNGLTAIKKSQTNKDEFATRLYVYGSERNLPHRYYNGKDILNAESVDIRNLMLPLDKWGLTDGLPDARKAYLENAEAVAKYGVIPKTHYFDSDDAGADIYPSIEGMTVGQLRKVLADMGETKYSPNASIYPNDSERVDEVWASPRMVDDGVLKKNGKEHDIDIGWYIFAATTPGTTIPKGTAEKTAVVENHLIKDLDIDSQGIIRAKITFTSDKICTLADAGYESVSGVLTLANSLDSPSIKEEVGFTFVLNEDGVWEGRLPKVIANYDKLSYMKYVAFATMSVYVTPKKALASDVTASVNISDGYVTFIADQLFDKTFQLTLKQIGFDINERAAMGEGKVISMKTGMCAGRNFVISECRYVANTDKWVLTCRRQQDDTLGMLFPNKDYQIAEGDQFVLLDIALPEVYIRANQERLLAEGEKLLAKASRIQNHYEPMIDAKVMIESGRTLREGMYMEISDEDVIDNGTDYILIDTLSIYEDESAIPTYKVTLREKRKVTYKGTPSATSETSTKSYGEEQTTEVDIDLSDYATKDYVDSKAGEMGGMFYWADEEHTTIGTKYNFFSEKENSAGGKGEAVGTSGGGIDEDQLQEFLDEKGYATEGYVGEQIDGVKTDIKTKPSTYVPLKTINGLSLYGTGNIAVEGGNGGSEGLTAINVNDESFQPDENGIVTLPDYPVVPTIPSALPNPKALTFGSKTYNGSVARTITESDIVSDIATIRQNANKGATALQSVPSEYVTETELAQKGYATTSSLNGKVDKVSGKGLSTNDYTTAEKNKLAGLENYDDTEVKKSIDALGTRTSTAEVDIATLQSFFVADKAKNADKLDGQDSRYFATASSVSTLNGTVSGLSESVTTLGEDMTDVKDRLATAESEIAANEGNIESQGNDIASLKLKMKDAEEDITDNANGIKDNAEDITDLDRRLDNIESWYNNVGSKFSKDTDGTIKMDGDFYTTGENSAGGVGESVGGTGGGGIDPDELDDILDAKGYAKEDWVNEQGFAKGTIPTRVSQLTNDKGYVTASDIPPVPTRVSQLENDANYLASITASMVKSALGYTPFNESNFSKMNIRTTLGISDWALATTKPPYSYSEIVNAPDMSNYATTAALDKKVDKVSGKGLSTNDYTNSEKSKLASLENYDDTDIKGRLSDLEEWYDEVGSKFTKESDGTIKMDGDFFTTGENSASGAGEAVGGTGGGIDTEELDDILDSKGYATEKWVKEQGFAKGAIPTTTSQLTNDSGFITTATADGRYASAGDFNDLEDRVQSIESGGGTGSGDIDLSAYATKKFVNDELTKKVDKEEGMGLSENNYTDEDKSTLASLEEWHRSIGSKFTIEDGAVKMDGDFFTTGENSAGGLGESVGSTGGGLDESELEDYLTDNKYAKQSWVEDQGYAKGTIPTRVSQLDNDAKYLASITSAMVTAALGYTPFSTANFTKLNIKNTLGISDWALASSKPPYSYGEIANTPDLSNYATKLELTTLQGKVATAEANIAKNSEAIADHTQDIDDVNGRLDSLEAWYNSVGSKFSKESDGSIKMTGDFFTTGENSAGGKGSEAFNLASVLDRIAALEDNAAKNLEIDFYELYGLQGTGISNAAMSNLVGLTDAAINDLLDGKCNKVIGKGTEREVWDYTAYETQQNIFIYFRRGDGFNTDDWYYLDYAKTTGKWNITFGEI